MSSIEQGIDESLISELLQAFEDGGREDPRDWDGSDSQDRYVVWRRVLEHRIEIHVPFYSRIVQVPRDESTALHMARRSDVPEPLLRALVDAHPDCLDMARVVAAHPNASDAVLAHMCVFLPEDAKAHPRYGSLKRRPDIKRVGGRAEPYAVIPACGSLPVDPLHPQRYKVDWYLQHGNQEDRQYILSLPTLSESALKAMLQSKDPHQRRAAAHKRDLSESQFRRLAEDRAKTVRLEVLKNPELPPALVERLTSDPDAAVRQSAMDHPNCLTDTAHVARIEEAERPTIHTRPTKQLAAKEVYELLSDPRTAATRLEELASTDALHVVFGCALHPNVPPSLCERLSEASTSEAWVAAGLAANPSTPVAVLERLAKWDRAQIRQVLSFNPNLPEALALALVETGDDEMRLALANSTQHESVWQAILELQMGLPKGKGEHWTEHLATVLDPKTKATALRKLQRGVATRHRFVARLVARHPNCPKSLYGQYAHYCQAELARNPKAGLLLLEDPTGLAKPVQSWVIDDWLAEAVVPGHIVDHLLIGDDPSAKRRAVNGRFASLAQLLPLVFDPDPLLRNRLAGRTDLPRGGFEVFARDPNPRTREIAAQNKACHRQALQVLAEDKVGAVRAAALQHPKYRPQSEEVDAAPRKSAGSGKSTGKVGTTSQPKAKATSKKKAKPNAKARSKPRNASAEATKVDAKATLRDKGAKRDRIRMAKDAKHAHVLEDLAQDKVDAVRAEVARNWKAPASALDLMAEDPNADVRLAVALHVNTPVETRDMLCLDAAASVRRGAYSTAARIIEHKKASGLDELVERMSLDDAPEVRAVAAPRAQTKELQLRLAQDSSAEVVRALGRNAKLDPEVAERVAHHPEPDVREDLARESRHFDTLLVLLDDEEVRVRKTAVWSMALHHKKAKLAEHPHPLVRYALATKASRIGDAAFDKLLHEPSTDLMFDTLHTLAVRSDLSRKRVEKLLATRHEPAVRGLIQAERLGAEDLHDVISWASPELLKEVASRGRLDEKAFEAIFATGNFQVVYRLSHNDSITEDQQSRVSEWLRGGGKSK